MTDGSSHTPGFGLDSGNMDLTILMMDAMLLGAWGPRYAMMQLPAQLATREFHYYGGPVLSAVTGTFTWQDSSFIVCTDDATVVVQRDYTGTVSINTTLVGDNLPMAVVTCAGGSITLFTDIRDTAWDRRGKVPPPGNEDDLLSLDASLLPVWLARSVVNPSGYPNGPLPDPAACQLFVDASDVGGVTDGNPITTWPDQSPNGLDLSNAGGTDRPIFRATDSEDGLPFVEFDGVNDFFERTGMTSYTGGPLTAYLVYRALNVSTTAGLFTLKKDAFGDFSQSDAFVVGGMDGAGRTLLSRNSVSYSFGEAGGSGLASPDARYTWAILAVRWKIVEGRAVLTLLRNNKILSYDLGTSLTAFAIVRATLGARNSAGGAPDNFAQVGIRLWAVKYSADPILTMRDTLRLLAHQWGVPLLD